ncbi:MAG TPA: NAD kinase [Bacteroidetes bacterium]|nr:NAD kinase [Bacteroidota bacterium]
MQVAVYGKYFKEKDLPYLQILFDTLHKENITTYVYAPYLEKFKEKINFKTSVAPCEGYLDFRLRKFDGLISMGGDGTILSAITLVRDSKVPILGINLGRLGFLASIGNTDIETALSLFKRGMYTIVKRNLLYLESNYPLFGDTQFALNDCTLLKRDTSSMITIHAYINGAYLTSFWADGIIISTPTGSTGYSLSCGGPIVFPDSGNFIITPVAPHNLNVRPIVISDDSIVSFEIEGRSETFLCTLDSRFETITSKHQLAIRKNDFGIRLVQMEGLGFLNTLRKKLAWGRDFRN